MMKQTTITNNLSHSMRPLMSPGREAWYYFCHNKMGLVGFWFIILLVLVALFADFIAPHSPIEQYRNAILLPPAWFDAGSWRFVLGTDSVGRDILSRLIYGARMSLLIGLLVVFVAASVGITFGLLAGFFRGYLEVLIMRLADVMLAVPSLLLAIAIVAVLGPSLLNAIISISIVSLPHYIRLSRASMLMEKNQDYVTLSAMSGASSFRLMFITILPNCLAPLIVQSTLGFSTAILDMAALGFLGFGAQPPTPEWGSMLADARRYIQTAWWVVTFPGISILLTVLSFNLMGDALRDSLDPKLKKIG